ncbi:Rieske (2Fe-2S) protein [Pontibacter pudoricolor]|uniref:hypothetical protein n=1 Tax=Pontibacter pudoricolor TaxID=2694930 RepID=UPI001EE4A92A|nr:hypothetical protein [Pontibacter pudoricolor]
MGAKRAKAFTTINKCLALLAIVILSACSSDNVGPGIPNVPVNEQISVNSLQYPMLRQDGGYAYIQAGYRGIIVIRQTASTYYAFERACPYDPAASCGVVTVDQSNLFLTHSCCGSQFNFQGNVTAGPAVYGLLQYKTSLANNILYITN